MRTQKTRKTTRHQVGLLILGIMMLGVMMLALYPAAEAATRMYAQVAVEDTCDNQVLVVATEAVGTAEFRDAVSQAVGMAQLLRQQGCDGSRIIITVVPLKK